MMTPSPAAVASGADRRTAPVGAGPFVVESFQQGQKVLLKKSPTYFQADDIRIAGIEMLQTGLDPQVIVNGLLSGQLDVATVSGNAVDAMRNNSDFEFRDSVNTNGWMQLYMCKSRPPFDDLRVRRALWHAVDREEVAEAVFGTDVPVPNSMWGEQNPFYNADLEDMYPYDPDRAKELLAEAGYNGTSNKLRFGAFYAPGDSQRMMEVIQQQFAAVGVEMSISVNEDIFNRFLTRVEQPMQGSGMGREGTGRVTRILGAGSPVNVCNYNNPELETTMRQLAAADQATPSKEAIDLWHKAQEIIWEDVAIIPIVHNPQTDVIRNGWTIGSLDAGSAPYLDYAHAVKAG
jgi:peptide/nickel transport system substrate-binding protein